MMGILSKLTTVISRPLFLGALVLSIVTTVYIKGRVDGYHKAEKQVVLNENKDLKELLENFKKDTAADVERIQETNRRLTELNNKLKKTLEDIANEIPDEDSTCNYPDGAADRLRESLKDANSSVFGESTSGPSSTD